MKNVTIEKVWSLNGESLPECVKYIFTTLSKIAEIVLTRNCILPIKKYGKFQKTSLLYVLFSTSKCTTSIKARISVSFKVSIEIQPVS